MNRNVLSRKLVGFCAAAAVTCSGVGTADAALILTGVVDGDLSGGLPKGIELYSNGATDLSQYAVGSANNGGGTDGPEFVLSGTAADGQYIYVASESTQFTNYFGFAPDFTNSAANINGDDAIELFFDATGAFGGLETVVDIYGVIDVDGTGEVWEHEDSFSYRKDNTGPDGSTFVPGNWTFGGVGALDGVSDNTGGDVPFGTYVIPEPASLALLGLGSLAMLGGRRRTQA